MTLDRTEATGLSVAIAAHIILFAFLSFRFGPPDPPQFDNPAMAVEIIAEAAPQATAPIISEAVPAARLGDPDSDEAEMPPPRPTPAAQPQRRPRPTPTPERASARTTPPPQHSATTPPRPATRPATRPAGDPLGDIVARTRNGQGRTPNPPAAQSAAQVEASITVALNREIEPHWRRNAPSGIDIDQLRLTLEITLNADGSVNDIRQIGPLTGTTESNRPQQQLFVERAIRSVRQAAPFRFPAEHFEAWHVVRQPFRVRGS